MQSDYAWPTLSFIALAAFAIAADWRRHHRRDADRARGRAGLIPWAVIAILMLIGAAFCVALWLRDG